MAEKITPFQDNEYHVGFSKIKYASVYLDAPIRLCTYCEKSNCICQARPKSGYRNYVDLKKL